MPVNYTIIAEKSIKNYVFDEQNEEFDTSDMIDFLNAPHHFRPFDEGLTELIIRAGYGGAETDTKAKADFLSSKLKQIGRGATKRTVLSWFSGERRPKIEHRSRAKMYEICFSLHLSLQDTVWFFHHVYFDRCFNCHTIEECVYFYCFQNGLPYGDAQSLIDQINRGVGSATDIPEKAGDYTRLISNRIASFTKTEDFVRFMIDNKTSFSSWNKSAYAAIFALSEELTGTDKCSPSDLEQIKKELRRQRKASSNGIFNRVNASLFENCGLLLREIYHDAKSDQPGMEAEMILELIDQKSVQKNSFWLFYLLKFTSGIGQKKDIPYVVKVNFPSKNTLSDVLGQAQNGQLKIETSQSYDTIRKILVLLHFYVFWLHVKLKDIDIDEYDPDTRFHIYRDEADSCLFDCGYEPLFAGNPYDWLFLCAANDEDPLAFFRECIAEITGKI